MAKTRCELSKKEYEAKETKDAEYICKSCGRVANKKEKVCKPKKNK